MSAPKEQPIPNVSSARSSNRAGTVSVRATSQGLPVEITFERGEYRYGAKALANEIMKLTNRSTITAQMQQRALLAEAGMPDDILNQLGLRTRREAINELDRLDDEDTGQTSWMRPV